MFNKYKTGWIGIDVGSSSIKAAQVVRRRSGLRVVASAIVPRRTSWEPQMLKQGGPLSSADELRCAVDLDHSFRGRNVAASLPMEVCEIHQIEALFETLSANHHAARRALETLIQRSAEKLQFGLWSAEPPQNNRKNPRCHLLAVDRRWADQLAADVLKNGWSCRVIDGLPHSLARAVQMGSPQQGSAPVAALDWGYGQVTFCVIHQGQPAYTRVLKECRLKSVLDVLVESLGVTHDEAHQLLQQYGVLSKGMTPDNDCQRVISDLIALPLKQIVRELERTLTHIKLQLPKFYPEKLFLFGGGALVEGIPRHFSELLEISTQVWNLPSAFQEQSTHSCLLGPAIALSALAWEKTG